MKCQSPEPPGSAVHGPPGATGSASAHADSLPALFARLQDELLGCLYCVTGNWEDARDALQETFLKCWRNQAKLAEVAHFKAWVFRVALNTGRDARSAAWRRRRQPLEEGAAMLIANHAPPDAAMEAADEVARVRTAVALLRAEEQEVFLLRQSAELSYEEIARTIEIPLGTVKTRMRMALAKLRAALSEAESGGMNCKKQITDE